MLYEPDDGCEVKEGGVVGGRVFLGRFLGLLVVSRGLG